FQNYVTFSKASQIPLGKIPHSNEFFTKFLKEIGYDNNSHYDWKMMQNFIQILGDVPNSNAPYGLNDPFNIEK
ncbi:hypothetical protein Anas_13778, partial [Armadillidium nasatum]